MAYCKLSYGEKPVTDLTREELLVAFTWAMGEVNRLQTELQTVAEMVKVMYPDRMPK